MLERVTGTVYILDEAGDCERHISVSTGEQETVAGTFGSLVINMVAKPPKIQGKGNVWVEEGGRLSRTTRMKIGQSVNICISPDGKGSAPAGSIEYKQYSN